MKLYPQLLVGLLVAGCASNPISKEDKSAQDSENKQLQIKIYSCQDSKTPSPDSFIAYLKKPGFEMLAADHPVQAIISTQDSGYAVAASTHVYSGGLLRGGGDILLVRFDHQLNPIWGRAVGGPAPDIGNDLIETADGGITVLGTTKSLYYSPLRWVSSGPEALLLTKFDGKGMLEWSKYIQEGGYYTVPLATPDGGIILAGTIQGKTRWGTAFLVKLNQGGHIEWSRKYGLDQVDGFAWIRRTAEQGYLAGGTRRETKESNWTFLVAKLDGLGNTIWAKAYSSPVGNSWSLATPNTDGGFLVMRGAEYDKNANETKIPLFNINYAGNIIWSKVYVLKDKVRITSLNQAPDDGFMIAGAALKEPGPIGLSHILRLDKNGNTLSFNSIEASKHIPFDSGEIGFTGDSISITKSNNGGFMAVSDLMVMTKQLRDKANEKNQINKSELLENSKMNLLFVKLDDFGKAGTCSDSGQITSTPLEVQQSTFDLPVSDLPMIDDYVPTNSLSLQYLSPATQP